MTTAFVLAGGGSHGTSPESLEGLAALWGGLRRQDVFPVHPHRLARGLIGASASLCSADRLHALVRENAGYDDLADAPIPLHVLTTALLTGLPVVLSAGPVADAVAASAAVPGTFRPVELGAEEIYVLPTGSACALAHPPRTAIGVAVHAFSLVIQRRLSAEIAALGPEPESAVRVLPPLCPLGIAPTDFTRAATLVRRGREERLHSPEPVSRPGGLPPSARPA